MKDLIAKTFKPLFAHILVICAAFAYLANSQWQRFHVNFAQFLWPDSDDVARVLEVRAWLDGQAFYDMRLHRINPPIGAELHWSRLSDLPLAITESILRLFFDHEKAEQIGVFFTPIILWSLAAVVLGITARALYKSNWSYLAGVVYMIGTDAVETDFNGGRVDHHGLQLITLYLLFLGLFKPNRIGGVIAGIALGASLTIGFELIPMQIIALAGLALVWLFDFERRNAQLRAFAISFAVAIIIGFVIDLPPEKYFNGGDNDRLSIAQLVPILMGCCGLYIATLIGNRGIKARLIALIATGGSVILAAMQFPILRQRLYWQISPLFFKLWMDDIGETFPTTKFPLHMQVMVLAFLVLATLSGWIRQFLPFSNDDAGKTQQQNQLILNLAMTTSLLLSWFYQVRIHLPAAGIAILVCAPLIAEALMQKPIWKGVGFAAIVGTILAPPVITKVWHHIEDMQPKPKFSKSVYSFGGRIACRARPDFAHLAAQPKGLVVTNINMGVETAYQTHHDSVTSHFHRDHGRDIAYDIFLSPPEVAYQKLKQYKIDYVAYCMRSMETLRIFQNYPNSMMGLMRQGKNPSFLEEIKKPDSSDILAYKVKK